MGSAFRMLLNVSLIADELATIRSPDCMAGSGKSPLRMEGQSNQGMEITEVTGPQA